MKGKPFVQDVDDVLFGSGTIGTLGREGVNVAVDGNQFIFNGFKFVPAFIQMLVQDVDGMSDLVDFLVDFVTLDDKRLFDADVVEGVTADGIGLRREKNIPLLAKELARDGC